MRNIGKTKCVYKYLTIYSIWDSMTSTSMRCMKYLYFMHICKYSSVSIIIILLFIYLSLFFQEGPIEINKRKKKSLLPLGSGQDGGTKHIIKKNINNNHTSEHVISSLWAHVRIYVLSIKTLRVKEYFTKKYSLNDASNVSQTFTENQESLT